MVVVIGLTHGITVAKDVLLSCSSLHFSDCGEWGQICLARMKLNRHLGPEKLENYLLILATITICFDCIIFPCNTPLQVGKHAIKNELRML